MQYVPNNSDSNYLVSNDDLSVMDLPRNMGKKVPMSNYNQKQRGRVNKVPTLIPPLKYIVYNNPQRVYDFLINKRYNVDNNIPSTYQFAKLYVKENGEPAILEIVKECHPDKELMLKAMGMNKESSFNGASEESKAKSEVKEDKKVEEPKKEVAKEESSGGIKLNTQTVIIALIIVVFFLLINRTNK